MCENESQDTQDAAAYLQHVVFASVVSAHIQELVLAIFWEFRGENLTPNIGLDRLDVGALELAGYYSFISAWLTGYFLFVEKQRNKR